MTTESVAHRPGMTNTPNSSSPAKAGDPVRRGFSALSPASLEYWIARSSRATTTRSAAHRPGMTGNKSPPSLRAQRSNPSLSKWRHGLLRFARNDDAQIQNTPPHSRGPIARVLPNRFPPKTEGAGNAGCALHPRSRVQNCAKEPHTSIQVQRKHSGIPRAMALRLMACSPRRRIRLVTVIGGLKVLRTRLDSTKTPPT